MNFRKARKLSNMLTFTGMGLFLLSFVFAKLIGFFLLFIAGIIFILTGIVVGLLGYRCPNCAKSLFTRTVSVPAFCPCCGHRFDSNHQ